MRGVFIEEEFRSSGLNPTLQELSNSLQTYLSETNRIVDRLDDTARVPSLFSRRRIAQDFVDLIQGHEAHPANGFLEFLNELREGQALVIQRAEAIRQRLDREARAAQEEEANRAQAERIEEENRNVQREVNQAFEVRRNELERDLERISIPGGFYFIRGTLGAPTPLMLQEDQHNQIRRENARALNLVRQNLLDRLRDRHLTYTTLPLLEREIEQLQRDAQANLYPIDLDRERLAPRHAAAERRLDRLESFFEEENEQLQREGQADPDEERRSARVVAFATNEGVLRTIANLRALQNQGSEANLLWLENEIRELERAMPEEEVEGPGGPGTPPAGSEI